MDENNNRPSAERNHTREQRVGETGTSTSAETNPRGRRAGALALLLAIFISTLAVVGASGQTAGASAFGCSQYRPIGTPWGTPSVNSYCARLDGSGTWVNYVSGSFTSNAGNLCNYNITAEFFDSAGRWYMTRATPVRYGCWWGTQHAGTIWINQNVRKGYMCSTLKTNGARVTSVCHNIY